MKRTFLSRAALSLLLVNGLFFLTGCDTNSSQRSDRGSQATQEDWPPSGQVRRGSGNRTANVQREMPEDDNMNDNMQEEQPVRRSVNTANRGSASMALHSGNANAHSMLLINTSGPTEVRRGETYEYEIMVKNISDYHLTDVLVSDHQMDDLTVVSSNPSSQRNASGGHDWMIDHLEPGETRTITVNAQVTGQVEEITYCVTADYKPWVCLVTNVIAPEIAITKSGPENVSVCDPIQYTITVTNTGVGEARNVVIEDMLPDGLTTASGRQSVRMDVGTLAAGQSKSYKVDAKATRSGTFTNTAKATAANGLEAESSSTLTVTSPELAITKTGPESDFIGVPVRYEITVRNTGDGAAENTWVKDTLPAGSEFVSASDGGTATAGGVSWNLGTLQPGDSKTVSVSVNGNRAGIMRNSAMAGAKCASDVSASAETQLKGIPALLLEVTDDPDPVRVGTNTTYTIVVTNQGSAEDDVNIIATLEPSVTFVSAAGDTGHRVDGNRIVFETKKALGPKQKAVWTVVVKGAATADSRFTVEMTSPMLKRPVQETESTNIYGGG